VAEKDYFTEQMIIDLVLGEHRLQPRLGGKKLYFMLHPDIQKIDLHFGRDKFFNLLRSHDYESLMFQTPEQVHDGLTLVENNFF
jgi:hypothetical protein